MVDQNSIDSGQAGTQPEQKRRTSEVIRIVFFSYLWNILHALDVFVNVVLGGDRRETISSRLGKGQVAGKPVHSQMAKMVNFFFDLVFNEQHHCRKSIVSYEDSYSLSSIISRARRG